MLQWKVKSLSRVQLFVTAWTVAYQAPLPMGFSRQQYWSGLPFPSPADLSNPGIEPRSPALQTDSLPSEPPGKSVYQASKKKKKKYHEPIYVIYLSLWLFQRKSFQLLKSLHLWGDSTIKQDLKIYTYIVNFGKVNFIFYFYLATPRGLWDLNSPTKDRTYGSMK